MGFIDLCKSCFGRFDGQSGNGQSQSHQLSNLQSHPDNLDRPPRQAHLKDAAANTIHAPMPGPPPPQHKSAQDFQGGLPKSKGAVRTGDAGSVAARNLHGGGGEVDETEEPAIESVQGKTPPVKESACGLVEGFSKSQGAVTKGEAGGVAEEKVCGKDGEAVMEDSTVNGTPKRSPQCDNETGIRTEAHA